MNSYRPPAATVYGDNGRIKETSRAARMRLRGEAAVVREDFALELYAKGETVTDIEAKLKAEYGVKYQRAVPAMIHRALVRRAEKNAPTVEAARALYLEQYRLIVETWMPYALGAEVNPDTGERNAPSLQATETVMKALDKMAEVQGAKEPRKRGDITINNIILPDDPDAARAAVQRQIDAERAKHGVIDSTFSEEGGLPAVDRAPIDAPPPPSIPLGPAPD